ncbi:MAG: hypothetical protein HC838_11450 [Spirulinaceae cyanobacterium RM2_2_10]|nr:hypothetical protein [Spirulinaceae cyanobacterium RM2_2_10]
MVIPERAGYGFWLLWVMATLLGFAVSLLLVEIGEQPQAGPLQGLLGGLCVGAAQALVLRDRLYGARRWLWACGLAWSLMGFASIGAVGWYVPRSDGGALLTRCTFGLLFGASGGVLLGVMQWVVLRRQVTLARLWLVLSPLVWAISLALGWVAGGVLRSQTGLFLGEALGLGLTWLLVAILTGWALAGMLDG